MKTIAILCSGGDSQGMNACIKAFVNTCTSHDIVPLGIRRGYQGLVENDMIFLDRRSVENIEMLGGTILKVSRSEEFKTPAGIEKSVRNLKKNNVDALVVLGGNGSYQGVLNLIAKDVKVIAIPATIDNDLFYTDRCMGFDSAVNNAVNSVDNIMQTITANDRGMIVRAMGRNCGDIALFTAVSVCAHSLATKELGTTIDDIVEDVKFCLDNGVKSPLVVLSENLDYGLPEVEHAIKRDLKIDTRSAELGYIQRGGSPSVNDRLLAIQFGILSVSLLMQGRHGLALGIDDEKIFSMPVENAVNVPQKFDLELYESLRTLHNLSI